jgi:hypothetical protein
MDQTRVLSISVGAGRRQKFGREQTEMAGRLRGRFGLKVNRWTKGQMKKGNEHL